MPTPSVLDNNKFRCRNDGSIHSFPNVANMKPCGLCGEINFDQIRITTVCDFCSTPVAEGEEHTVPADDFLAYVDDPHMPNQMMTGDWCACPTCFPLTEANDWRATAKRAADLHVEREPHLAAIRDTLESTTYGLHSMVGKQRTGPGYKGVPPGEER